MDNKLINVDDLIRQRLGGEEERERAGAWLRMSDLLEKEMPVRPAGLYWRRMFGALGVLLIMGLLTAGGFEMTAFMKRGSSEGNMAAGIKAPAGVTATPPSTATATGNNDGIAAGSTAVSATGNDATANNTTNHAKHTTIHRKAISSTKSDNGEANELNIDTKATAANTNSDNTGNEGGEHAGGKQAGIAAIGTKKGAPGAQGTMQHNDAKRNNADVVAGKQVAATPTAVEKATTPGDNGLTAVNHKEESGSAGEKPTTAGNKTEGGGGNTAGNETAVVTTGKATTTGNKAGAKHRKTTATTAATGDLANISHNESEDHSGNLPAAPGKGAAPAGTTDGIADGGSHSAGGLATTGNGKAVPAIKKINKKNTATVKTEELALGSNVVNNTIPKSNSESKKLNKKAGNIPAITNKEVTGSTAMAGNSKTSGAKHKAITGKVTATDSKAAGTADGAESNGTPAGATTTTATPTGAAGKDGKATAAVTNTKKMPLGGHAPATKEIKGVNADKVIAETSRAATGIAGSNHAAKKGTGSGNSTAGAGKTGKAGGAQATATGGGGTEIAENSGPTMGKRTIEKLVLHEHFVKTSDFQGHYVLDTISYGKYVEEYAMANEGSGIKTASARAAHKAGPSGNLNSNGSSAAQPVTPGATASASGKAPATLKETVTDKKSAGATSMENLSAAFNDIKQHVSAVQFAPGLTAGINGTFFGPNNFKGFQFGVTGNFIFGENFSVLTELKYFHRINNDYAVNDNYYSYTPVAGGFSKQVIVNQYSFSALHGFELPLAAAFRVGNFRFYLGGNFVYNFSINTGAGSPPSNDPATTVLVKENDEAPKLKIDDFNSRFGFGYLFGMSYSLSQNMNLDFRNVQTIWDNSNTTGAKIISDDLYRSPSLQVSFGYRLGGNKGKKD